MTVQDLADQSRATNDAASRRQRINGRIRVSLVVTLFMCVCALTAHAQDPVATGKAIGNFSVSEILGVVCVALVGALAYKDRTMYQDLKTLVAKNIETHTEVKNALYADALTRKELAKALEHCKTVQEERARQEAQPR